MGRCVSLAFLQEAAHVIVTYRKEEEFQSLRALIGERASVLDGYKVDLNNEKSTSEFINTVARERGAIDVLVNAVGAYAGGSKLWEQDPGTFERMLSANLRSGYLLARAVMPVMLRAGRGSIVNVAAKAAIDHAAGASAYAASKAAAVALMDCLAADALGTGVRVNSVLPSIIDTPANRSAMPQADFRTWPKPEQIAQVILFLASSAAESVHGASVPVYGHA